MDKKSLSGIEPEPEVFLTWYTAIHRDMSQKNLRVLLQMNDNDIGVDTTHIGTILMDPELKASQCSVSSLKQYSIAV